MSRQQLVSLRQLFPSAQIVGAEDIQCHRCHHSSIASAKDWIFAAGLENQDDLARDTVDAINCGASAIMTEQFLPSSVPQCIVSDIREAYAILSHAIAGRPSTKLLTIAVVGTHGKTTASLIVASMLKHVGNRVAYYTSLGASDGSQSGLSTRHDADAGEISQWLAASVQNEAPAAVLELTDEMIQSHATSGLEFDVVLFTGLRKSQRLDTLQTRGVENGMHRAMSQIKKHGIVVYNADDARLNRWIERHQSNAIGYGLDADADVRGKRMGSMQGEQSLMISAGNCVTPMTSRILGDHNARHMLGAAAVGYAFGLELFEIVHGIERMQRVPGRMQRVSGSDENPIYIDQADQADRLAMSLHALSKNGTPIVCVAEVPDAATPDQLAAYGRVLARASSQVILTQSRVSTALGQRGMWQVLDGCENPSAVQIVPDREAAIELAIRSCRSGDQVLLAGWGTQLWTNCRTKKALSDLECASKVLASLASEPASRIPAKVAPRLRLYGGAS